MGMWIRCLLGMGLGVGMALIGSVAHAQTQARAVSFEDLARMLQYQDVKVAPDGKHLAATAVIDDQPVLALVDLETRKGATIRPREGDQVIDFWWVNPHRIVYTVGTRVAGFDRPAATGELFAVNADGGSAQTLFGYRVTAMSTGSLIQHASAERASATMIDRLRDDENHVLVGVDGWDAGADGAFTQVFVMEVRDGSKHSVTQAPLRNASFVTDRHGVPRFAVGRNGAAQAQVFYRASDGAPWKLLFAEDPQRGMSVPLAFNRDDTQVWMDCGGTAFGICPWNVATQTLGPPAWSSDTVASNGLIDSLDGRDVVGVSSMPGTPAVAALVPDADTIKVMATFARQFSGEFAEVVSSTDDGSKAVVLVWAGQDPGTFYLWDKTTGKATELLQRASWIHPNDMAAMQPVAFKARDGVALHGYLSLPPGKEDAKHLPLVVFVHGGPFGIRDEWGYDPYVQMLATHGYAVLQVNYRGSGGYGYGFMRAGYRQWGGTMQDDVTDATRWAIAQGVTDAGHVCIFGGSYGGYAALEGVVSQPDLYRCAIGYVGVYDLGLMYRRGDIPQSSMGESYLHEALGDDMQVLAAHSPVNQLDHLKANVMLVVGGVDTRVPPMQGEALHRALLDRHIAHEWLYKAGEGHGFYTNANRAELFSRVVGFLDHNIGGSGQAGAP
jgi:dienelactone hydrolase